MLLLLLLAVAAGKDASHVTDADEAAAKGVQLHPLSGVLQSRTADVMLASCAAGATAAGAALCRQAGALAGGGYVAAGISGLAMALSRRKARLASRKVEGLKGELAELRASTRAVQAASGEIAESVAGLWSVMKGSNDRLASSLDRPGRLQLLELMQKQSDSNGSEHDIGAAEHYLLRHFPQKDMQAVLLAAARVGAARVIDGAAEGAHATPTEFLPKPMV